MLYAPLAAPIKRRKLTNPTAAELRPLWLSHDSKPGGPPPRHEIRVREGNFSTPARYPALATFDYLVGAGGGIDGGVKPAPYLEN